MVLGPWNTRDSRPETVPVPLLHEFAKDAVMWRDTEGKVMPFSVRQCMTTFERSQVQIGWYRNVWFPHHIPKHSFCLWLACHGRLPIQDCIMNWKKDPRTLSARFCSYSMEVWRLMKAEAQMEYYPNDWLSIVGFLSSNTTRRCKLHKLTFVAMVYFIWQERNRRLFSDVQRQPNVLMRNIRDIVLKRMAWKTNKNLNQMQNGITK
ncbi:hypothetical protein OSB04_011020 [Centaurea solstitialis]|uniref:Reverse transcriptase zinc-binding domain-containing protein n=1 Tax=Centaurea solstitialis TaxID=347529 RepID=A0AA38TJD1_9ASTR|nr:hypothetical protein OSB04_011020 [Centaurea solstitialis]